MPDVVFKSLLSVNPVRSNDASSAVLSAAPLLFMSAITWSVICHTQESAAPSKQADTPSSLRVPTKASSVGEEAKPR